jgi:RHS repeat-associated protein
MKKTIKLRTCLISRIRYYATVLMLLTVPATQAAVTLNYVQSDHLGTPRALSNNSGDTVWQLKQTPFGKTTINQDVDGDGNAVVANLRFPGQYFDQETGLHYNYFRYYDPQTGRYITSDPLGLVPSLNTYAYVDSNPLSFIDPTGLAKCVYSISGHTVVCTTDDGNQSTQAGPDGLFSGQQECKDNPDCADEKDKGPTPPGTYEMIPSEKYGGSWWLKEGFFTRQFCKLGIGRCEFFFHEGTISEGCITVDRTNENARKQFNDIKKILRTDPTNTMTVVP